MGKGGGGPGEGGDGRGTDEEGAEEGGEEGSRVKGPPETRATAGTRGRTRYESRGQGARREGGGRDRAEETGNYIDVVHIIIIAL